MQNELKKMKEEIDKQRLILSKEAMQEKEAKFQQKFFELQKTAADFEREFAQKEAEAMKPIVMKIQTAIQKIGSDGGYTMIVPSDVALYTQQGSDLTKDVIAAVNKAK